MPCSHHLIRTALLLLLMMSSAGHAAKTDVVVLINGNAVTGEIKRLEFGSLRYSTDSMGTVSIDWEDIVSVTSNQDLQIELTDGTRYFGKLLAPDDRFVVAIRTASQDLVLPADQIVRITPIDTAEHIWERFDGSFAFGIKAEKASDIVTSDLNADISYRTRKYLLGLKVSSSVTDQPEQVQPDGTVKGGTTARQNTELNYQRFRANRWFTDWFTRWERNDELGISSRIALGGALGRYLVQTNKNQFSITAGIQGAQTSYTGEDVGTTEGEGRIEFRYLRRNLVPETAITLTSTIYPLLEDPSTYRAETDIALRREFYKDLFWELNLGSSYISDPPTGAASSDYTITTSVGYSF